MSDSMTPKTVGPALSSEEWEALNADWRDMVGRGHHPGGATSNYYDFVGDAPAAWRYIIALNNHALNTTFDEPFGFTEDDLRRLISVAYECGQRPELLSFTAGLHDLTSRIQALLPPPPSV